MWRFISLKLWQGPSTWSCMQNLTMWSKSIETDKSCLTTVHNTLENDTLLKKHPHSRPVFKGVYARNSLPWLLNVPSALVGNTDPDHRMGQPWVATTLLEHHPFQGLTWTLWTNIVRVGLTIPFKYKKKDLPCADIIAFFTSFIDVQDIASKKKEKKKRLMQPLYRASHKPG